MASSSSWTSFSTDDIVRLGCTRLNDNVYELHRPTSGPISMQILFFHGFQMRGCEDAFIRTWMTHDGSKCWLNTWLVESIPQAHILSVSYDSSTRTSHSEGRQDLYLIGENVARILVEVVGVGRDCPVVLVGHCVGGLVLKEVCLKANQMMQEEGSGLHHRKFLANLRGMFFYATAQLGSQIPLTSTANLIQLQGAPLLTYLHLLNTSSARINEDFRKLRRRYNWRTYGVMEANETRTVMLMPFFDREILPSLDFAASSEYQMVVCEGSGRYDLDECSSISGVDHFTISNPKDQYSNSFVHLINFLKTVLEQEDESNRDLERRLELNTNWICFETRICDVIQLLDLQNPQPKKLSIIGMDGIGKSILVRQILVRIQHQFDFVCFLEFENVPHKQKWIDFERMFTENLYRGSGKRVTLETESPWFMLKRKKILIIVDDVEDQYQIKRFQEFKQFGEGSRLIITTCNKNLISQFMAFIEFDVPLLTKEDAEELFRVHVDNSLLRKIPKELVSQIVDECDGLPLALELVSCYLSRKKDKSIWSSALDRLRIRTTKALDGVGENEIWKWFKVIFYDLNQTEQKVFLDLATFDVYGHEKTQYDLYILKAAWRTGLGCDGTSSDHDMAIENLEDRCILRVVLQPRNVNTVRVQTEMDAPFSHIYIHKLLRNIGRWISRLVNEEVDLQHGRGLWELQQIKDVLNKTKGEVAQRIKRLEVLSVAMEFGCNDSFIKWSSISRFEALRLMRMSNVDMTRGSDKFILPQSLAMLHLIDCSGPQSRWYPWQPDWPIRVENVECLLQLSVLLLDNCKSIRLPKNIHRLQNLRILQIHDSTKDTNMQLPENFGLLPALEHLSLSAQVMKLPDSLLALSSLKSMRLSNCSILKEWPMPARVNPSSNLNCLTSLELSNLPGLAHLPDTFGGLRSLRMLYLFNCSALEGLPEGFSALQQLTELYIFRCERFKTLCESFHSLSRLRDLILWELPALQTLPSKFGLLPSLENLGIEECSSLEELPEIGKFSSLTSVTVERCGKLECVPRSLMQIASLEQLSISDCENLKQLPDVSSQLSNLTRLWIMAFHLPESIGELKSLRNVSLKSLRNVSESSSSLTPLETFGNNFEGWQNFSESIGQLTGLQSLSFSGYQWLVSLPESLGQLHSLEGLTIANCGNLHHLPDSLGQLPSLKILYIEHCGTLHHLPDSLGQLPSLDILYMKHCRTLHHLPDSLGQLSLLQMLEIGYCINLHQLPDSLCQLPLLKTLKIEHCGNLHHLPDSLGQVSSLIYLSVVDCESFLELPKSVCQLKRLYQLELRKCGCVDQIPQWIGDLESLTTLLLQDCGVMDPQDFALSLRHLTKLEKLGLPPCRSSRDSVIMAMTESLKELTTLKTLRITSSAENFEVLFESLWQFTSLQYLFISHVDHLERLPESVRHLSQLRQLYLESCQNLIELPKTLGEIATLETLVIRDCGVLKALPESTGRLKGLEYMYIERCDSFEHLPESMVQLKLQLLGIRQCKSLDLKQLSSSLLAVLVTDWLWEMVPDLV